MSGDRDLDLDAILAEFHRQDAPARPQPPKTASRRELRERAELEAARKEAAGSGDKTVLFETVTPGRPAEISAPPAPEMAPAAPESRKKAPAASGKKETERAPKAAGGRKKAKKAQEPGKAFALMFLVLLALGAVLAGLLDWTSRAEQAAAPAAPQEIRLSLGEDLEALLDEEAATSR